MSPVNLLKKQNKTKKHAETHLSLCAVYKQNCYLEGFLTFSGKQETQPYIWREIDIDVRNKMLWKKAGTQCYGFSSLYPL